MEPETIEIKVSEYYDQPKYYGDMPEAVFNALEAAFISGAETAIVPKIITPIEDGVNRRFFQAIEALVSLGRLSALESFCKEAGLSASRYRETRFTYGVTPRPGKVSRYKSIQIEALYYLVAKYSVSSDWLLTGRGNMFSK